MTERKARRRLSNFDFTAEGAHLALVHKEQGGAANGYKTLVMKASSQFSDDFLEKIQKANVSMELEDFLDLFYELWESNAEELCVAMGYDVESGEDVFKSWYLEKCKEESLLDEDGNAPEPTNYDHQMWLSSKLENIDLLKSLKESDSVAEVLSKLSEDEYLTMLRDQERIEKALTRKESALAEKAAREAAVVAEKKKPKMRIMNKAKGNEAEKAVVVKTIAQNDAMAVKADKPKTEVSKMTNAIEVEVTQELEMVEKSEYELVIKAQEEIRLELEKARATLAKMEADRKLAIQKARRKELAEAIVDEELSEKMYKAVGELGEEPFEAVLSVVKMLAAQADKGEMFVEKGASLEQEQVTKSALRARLEAKYTAK